MATPSKFGPNEQDGSLSAGTSRILAGGLGAARGTPVGRSSRDPERLLERQIRRAGTDREKAAAALQLANFQDEKAAGLMSQKLNEAMVDYYSGMANKGASAPPPATPPPAPPAPPPPVIGANQTPPSGGTPPAGIATPPAGGAAPAGGTPPAGTATPPAGGAAPAGTPTTASLTSQKKKGQLLNSYNSFINPSFVPTNPFGSGRMYS